ncbi:NADH-quinone oxidoreductase subunit NuoK [Intrasporangium sp. DVR]|uniref:NADH-quinone oxidoreductase subunit NuoK n=1 Tax=Intrasporangium sp. DVR TaxID=3127867 RepID=UPI00313A595F
MSLVYPAALAALLAGIGVYGVLARRNAVLMLIGVELILNAANLLFVTAGARSGAPFAAGPVLALFVITIAAAEVVVALAIVLVMFRRFGHIDLTATPDLTDDPERDESLGVAAAGSVPETPGETPARQPGRPVAEEIS